MKPLRVMSIVILEDAFSSIPITNKTVLNSNKDICKENDIPFDLFIMTYDEFKNKDYVKSHNLVAKTLSECSNNFRVDYCKHNRGVLYLDWDCMLLSIPKNLPKGPALSYKFHADSYGNRKCDCHVLWSGVSGSSFYQMEKYELSRKNFSSWYKSSNASDLNKMTIDSWIRDYQTGLGR